MLSQRERTVAVGVPLLEFRLERRRVSAAFPETVFLEAQPVIVVPVPKVEVGLPGTLDKLLSRQPPVAVSVHGGESRPAAATLRKGLVRLLEFLEGHQSIDVFVHLCVTCLLPQTAEFLEAHPLVVVSIHHTEDFACQLDGSRGHVALMVLLDVQGPVAVGVHSPERQLGRSTLVFLKRQLGVGILVFELEDLLGFGDPLRRVVKSLLELVGAQRAVPVRVPAVEGQVIAPAPELLQTDQLVTVEVDFREQRSQPIVCRRSRSRQLFPVDARVLVPIHRPEVLVRRGVRILPEGEYAVAIHILALVIASQRYRVLIRSAGHELLQGQLAVPVLVAKDEITLLRAPAVLFAAQFAVAVPIYDFKCQLAAAGCREVLVRLLELRQRQVSIDVFVDLGQTCLFRSILVFLEAQRIVIVAIDQIEDLACMLDAGRCHLAFVELPHRQAAIPVQVHLAEPGWRRLGLEFLQAQLAVAVLVGKPENVGPLLAGRGRPPLCDILRQAQRAVAVLVELGERLVRVPPPGRPFNGRLLGRRRRFPIVIRWRDVLGGKTPDADQAHRSHHRSTQRNSGHGIAPARWGFIETRRPPRRSSVQPQPDKFQPP